MDTKLNYRMVRKVKILNPNSRPNRYRLRTSNRIRQAPQDQDSQTLEDPDPVRVMVARARVVRIGTSWKRRRRL